MMAKSFTVLVLLVAGGCTCWRYHWFFRDPERKPLAGRIIVAPPDGKVVCAHRVEDGQTPVALKKGQRIGLEEVAKTARSPGKYWHVGVSMFPWSVHVNRIPLDGQVALTQHHAHPNRPMSDTYIRGVLGLKPMYRGNCHSTEKERNTVLTNGDLPTCVVQIADAYVNKIECWVSPGDRVHKGQRLGRIVMGSQVDLIFPTGTA